MTKKAQLSGHILTDSQRRGYEQIVNNPTAPSLLKSQATIRLQAHTAALLEKQLLEQKSEE